MSKRNDRRAAEREARKLAYQQLRQQSTQSATVVEEESSTPESETETPAAASEHDLFARAQAFFSTSPEPEATPAFAPISEAQLTANRANAQLSTGPKSMQGKAKSSRNAVKHGLTSQTVVLAGEDNTEYDRSLESYIDRYKPADEEELRLVQSLLDSHWRLNRVLQMETAILLKGETEFANKFEDAVPAHREGLMLAEIYLKYEKSLRNLHTQEARLRRSREKDQAELTRLQANRKREEKLAAETETTDARPPQSVPSPRPQVTNGFDFSTYSNTNRSPHTQAA